MKLERFYFSQDQAAAFASGLSEASDGNIHSIETRHVSDARGTYRVTWEDESRKPVPVPEDRPPLTPQEYVRSHEGTVCPVCGGLTVVIERRKARTPGHNSAEIPVYCDNPDCEASWTNIYELSGYEDLKR